MEAEAAGSTYIAVATGGKGFFANDATEAVAHVLEEAKAYYLIGFRPAQGRPGERQVRVRVSKEGLRVRARNRYYWGDPLPRGNDDTVAVRVLRAMSDRTDVPIRVVMAPAEATHERSGTVRLQLALDPVPERRARRLKLLIEARPLAKAEPVRDGADLTVPASDVPRTVERKLRLAPGVWQARVVVTDEETGAVGSVLHTFEVPGAPSDRSRR
jgi:hypothetical protein